VIKDDYDRLELIISKYGRKTDNVWKLPPKIYWIIRKTAGFYGFHIKHLKFKGGSIKMAKKKKKSDNSGSIKHGSYTKGGGSKEYKKMLEEAGKPPKKRKKGK